MIPRLGRLQLPFVLEIVFDAEQAAGLYLPDADCAALRLWIFEVFPAVEEKGVPRDGWVCPSVGAKVPEQRYFSMYRGGPVPHRLPRVRMLKKSVQKKCNILWKIAV